MFSSAWIVRENKGLTAIAGVLLILAPGLVSADNAASVVTPMVQEAVKNMEFSGFLSIRGGMIDEKELIYANKYDNRWTFSEESVFGLQMNTTVSNDISVSMQMTASGGDNPVELEWAYLEYAFDSDLKARFGRLRVPGFMLSEFLDVGYAYPWVQTPYEVYGWLPFSRYEGMDLRYWTSVGNTDLRFNPFLGTTSGQGLSIGEAQFADQTSEFAGLDVQATYDILTVRAGYSKYKFDLSHSRWDRYLGQIVNGVEYVPDMAPYIDGVKLPGFVDFVSDVMVDGILDDLIANPALAAAAGVTASEAELRAEQQSLLDQLPAYQAIPGMDGKRDGSFAGVGFSLDNGSYLVMSEVSKSEIGGVYPDVESGYVMVGYRFGAWMPNITFAKMYTTDDDERPDLGQLQLNDDIWRPTDSSPLAAVADGAEVYSDVLAGMNDIVRLEEETWTLGLRWDPSPGIAVKAEVFRSRMLNDSFGFALPAIFFDITETSSVSLEGVEIPEPPDNIEGMRLSIDAVF